MYVPLFFSFLLILFILAVLEIASSLELAFISSSYSSNHNKPINYIVTIIIIINILFSGLQVKNSEYHTRNGHWEDTVNEILP